MSGADNSTDKIKTFIVCSGLGYIYRGFESFTQEFFDEMVNDPALDLTLFKGAGETSEREIVVSCEPRESEKAKLWGRLTGTDGYFIEQVTFGRNLLPHIARLQPDVIIFSDINIGNTIWWWRCVTRNKVRLLLSNGAPFPPPFPRWNHIQQLAPRFMEIAKRAKQDLTKMTMLPYGFHMAENLALLTSDERRALRAKLGLPADRVILLTVGVLDKQHKRMDYVIKEVARLPLPRPFLLMVGYRHEDTDELSALADNLLGPEHYAMRTVPHEEMNDHYNAADVFVLASLSEGFGRVFVEALAQGLPCLAHDYDLTRYVIGDDGYLGEFQKENSLAEKLCEALSDEQTEERRRRLHRSVFERFSWQSLHEQYVAMIQKCAHS